MIRKNMKWIVGALLGVFVLSGLMPVCSKFMNGETGSNIVNSTGGDKPLPDLAVPKFNADSAYLFTDKIVSFGPRVTGTPTAMRVKIWVIDQFKKYGADIIEQNFKAKIFDGKTLDATNIVARFNLNATNRILLTAHWDARPFAESDSVRKNEPILGADDSGSAMGTLIEIASQLQKNPLSNLGVDIVLFDAEDYGDSSVNGKANTWALGSQYWSARTHVAGYKPKYGINLDMIGARNARFPKEENSVKYASAVVEKIWRVGRSLGYASLFVDEPRGPVTDDHVNVNTIAKIPMANIINLPTDSYFGKYHHTHNDNMSIIDKETLKMTGQTLLHLLHYENAGAFDH